jgi:hypothetical protein
MQWDQGTRAGKQRGVGYLHHMIDALYRVRDTTVDAFA